MPTKSQTVYVRMPQELYDRLEAEAKDRGETLSVIIRECARKHLDSLQIHDQPGKSTAAANAGGRVATKYPSLHRHK